MRGIWLALALVLAAVTAHAEDTYKIGFAASLSGQFAVQAGVALQGLTVAVERANATNQAGRKIEIVAADDASDPRTANDVCNRLALNDHVDAVVANEATPQRNACEQALVKAGIPMVGATGGAGKLCFANLVLLGQESSQLMLPMADYLWRKGFKRIYFVGGDYASPHEAFGLISDDWTKRGGQIVGSTFSPNGTADFAAAISRVAEAKPDIVWSAETGADDITFQKQFAADPRVASIARDDTLIAGTAARAVGKGLDGVYGASPYDPAYDHPANKAYKDAVKAKYGDKGELDQFSVLAYEAVQVLADAVKRVGPDKKAMVAAIQSAKWDGPSGENNVSGHYTTRASFIGRYNAAGDLITVEKTPPFPPVDQDICH